jgi:hypothetical protein
VCGALELAPHGTFLPTAGRLYMRKGQLPDAETFRSKPELAVELLRDCAKSTQGPHLAIFDGGYAVCSVVQPLSSPSDQEPRVEFLTRLRFDSRLYVPLAPRNAGHRGRPRKWGKRLSAPKDADRWPGRWCEARARVYGKMRHMRYKKVLCQWHPAGPDARLHAFAFRIEGYKKPWYLVTSDLGLNPEEVLELYAARFTQEDGHRDLKQHVGLGVCQGRVKNVVLRTFQLRLAAMTLLRALGERLELAEGDAWWPKPPWYCQKQRGSFRDLKLIVTDAAEHFSQLDWHRPTLEKPACRALSGQLAARRAA